MENELDATTVAMAGISALPEFYLETDAPTPADLVLEKDDPEGFCWSAYLTAFHLPPEPLSDEDRTLIRNALLDLRQTVPGQREVLQRMRRG